MTNHSLYGLMITQISTIAIPFFSLPYASCIKRQMGIHINHPDLISVHHFVVQYEEVLCATRKDDCFIPQFEPGAPQTEILLLHIS